MSQGKASRLLAQSHNEEAEVRRLSKLMRRATDQMHTGRAERYASQLQKARESLARTREQLESIRLGAEVWADDMIELVGLKNEPNSDAHKAWNHLRDAALSLPELTDLGVVRDA